MAIFKEELIEAIGKASSNVAYGILKFQSDEQWGYKDEDYLWIARFENLEQFTAWFSGFPDFEYNNGFGIQHLFGTIVFEDGSWLERGEYDGSEWWEFNSTPTREEIFLTK